MLMPKRTKYRRPHRVSYEGKAILRKKQLIINEQTEEPLGKGKKITDTEKISEQVTIT